MLTNQNNVFHQTIKPLEDLPPAKERTKPIIRSPLMQKRGISSVCNENNYISVLSLGLENLFLKLESMNPSGSIDEALGSTGYFARPFASWERGSNENFNSLLRQYVLKKRQMANITDEEIKMIENRLNNRPRKRLGFRTPAEVFHKSLSRVALRA